MDSRHAADRLTPRADQSSYETDEPVLYAVVDDVATVTMNRPQFNNAQNSQMTYALDDAFDRAVDDDAVASSCCRRGQALLRRPRHRHAGARRWTGPSSAVQLWSDHTNKPAREALYTREQEVYLGMCRRWRDLPKPTIAHGAGRLHRRRPDAGLGLRPDRRQRRRLLPGPGASRMGIPGVEYFAHA